MDALTPPPPHPRPVPAPAVQETAGRRAAAHRAAGRRGHLRLVTTGAIPRTRATGPALLRADGRGAAMPELTRRPPVPHRPPRSGGAARATSRRSFVRQVPSPSRPDPARLAPMHPAVRAQRRRREAARTPGSAASARTPATAQAAAPSAVLALPTAALVLRRAGAAGLAALAPVLLALVGIALVG